MKVRIAPLMLLSGVALATTVHASEPAAPPAQSVDETTATAEYNGMKVAIDKKTGKLRPLTPAESRELDAMLTRQGRSEAQNARRGLPAPPATERAAIASAGSCPWAARR